MKLPRSFGRAHRIAYIRGIVEERPKCFLRIKSLHVADCFVDGLIDVEHAVILEYQ